jgi:hypothetical protein
MTRRPEPPFHPPAEEPLRDPELSARLARAVGPVPLDEVHWGALATRIRQGAAARRRPVAWWALLAAWARPGVPIALAAGILAAMVVARESAAQSPTAEALLLATTAADTVALDALAPRLSEDSLFSAILVGEEPR